MFYKKKERLLWRRPTGWVYRQFLSGPAKAGLTRKNWKEPNWCQTIRREGSCWQHALYLPANASAEWHSSEICWEIPKFLLMAPSFQWFGKTPTFASATWTSFPLPTGDKVAFVTMRDFEPSCLRHNEMASCFKTLCVIIVGSALSFLYTRTNFLRFIHTYKYLKYLFLITS